MTDLLDLIGNTPLVRATRLDTGPCSLFLKLENQNPGGSIKDRVALSIVQAALAEGRLKPGGTLVEATAGNTGLGLALVGKLLGYRTVLVVPDKMSQEKVTQLRALGADVRITRSDVGKGHPEYYQDLAERLASEIPGAFYTNQFANPANARAHELGTGPEIIRQMEGRLDAVVAGVGSGGTLTGLTQAFRNAGLEVEMVLADPAGSIVAEYVAKGSFGASGSWAVEGIGEDFIPDQVDLTGVGRAYTIGDAESFATARTLYEQEGILGGSSTGTLVAAALRYCREQTVPRRVVVLVPDTGTRYLSKVYNTNWLLDQGLVSRPPLGDLRDHVTRRFTEDQIIQAGPGDSLRTVFRRMGGHDVSFLPVLRGDQLLGLVEERELLALVADNPDRFLDPVSRYLQPMKGVVDSSGTFHRLLDTVQRHGAALVTHEGRFYGIVTSFDLLNGLGRRAS
jgi:cystathionine beta-synthase